MGTHYPVEAGITVEELATSLTENENSSSNSSIASHTKVIQKFVA